MTALQAHFRAFATTTLVLAITLLQACGTAPPSTDAPPEPEAPAVSEPETPSADVKLPPSVFATEFAAANAALAQQNWMMASAALAPLEDLELADEDGDYLQYMRARIEYVRGDQDAALASLAQLDRPGLHPGIAYRAHNFQRHLLGLEGHHLASAELGVRIMATAPQADRGAIKRSIWQDLERCPASSIAEARSRAIDPTWLGWLELADIAITGGAALDGALATWQSRHPQHPAANPLPGGLDFLAGPVPAPTRVALLLPLSGRLAPAGKAVRDGYLAHYFQARRAGEATHEVLVIDTDRYTGAAEAYNDAVLQGAQLVIGPLSKSSVSKLAAQMERPVPVIALNRIEQTVTPASSALVQLSLAPEDEARQLAREAFGSGARRALILRPAGAWGDKTEAALRNQWHALGGTVAQSVAYTGKDDYSPSVKAGLGIEASEQRRRKVRDMLASNVEFTPRRRADIDAIFMLSRTPEEARALRPLLAFHYAGALPVYATSSVYGGRRDRRDKDLDGTRILELPWLLGSNPSLKQSLDSSNSHLYTRLNALGIDAFLLQSRFAQLQAGPDALIRGDTGLLSMNPQLQIERELPAAIFDGDRLRPL